MQFGTLGAGETRKRGDRQRGATLVEYALGIALVCAASVGALEALEDNVSDNIVDHGAVAGAPDLPDTGIPTTTATTTSPTTSPPGTTAVPAVTATATVLATRQGVSSNGNSWSPSIDISASNTSNGQTLSGVTISVTFTYTTQNGQSHTSSSSCAAPSTNVCSFQLNSLNTSGGNCVATVTATVTSITSSSQTITYPADSVSTTITGPTTCA